MEKKRCFDLDLEAGLFQCANDLAQVLMMLEQSLDLAGPWPSKSQVDVPVVARQ